jgi:hypothetical protein
MQADVINTNWDSQFQTLEYLIKRVGQWIDLLVKASFHWNGKPHAPVTPVEFCEEPNAARKNADAEKLLLASLDRRRQLIETIRRGDATEVARTLDAHPELLTPELWPAAIYDAKSYDITKLLLDRGLSPDLCSAPRKPLRLAVYQCLPDSMRLIVSRRTPERRASSVCVQPWRMRSLVGLLTPAPSPRLRNHLLLAQRIPRSRRSV